MEKIIETLTKVLQDLDAAMEAIETAIVELKALQSPGPQPDDGGQGDPQPPK
jgi:hypothetical protein